MGEKTLKVKAIAIQKSIAAFTTTKFSISKQMPDKMSFNCAK